MLAKRIAIATIAVLFLIVFMRWGTEYVQAYATNSANPEKVTLTKEIEAVNRTIARMPKRDEQLALRLAEVEKELADQGKAIPQSMDGTMVINTVLELAKSSSVSVTPLQTVDWSAKSDNYRVYTLQIQAEGNYEQIAAFIGRLENELFDNLVIVSLDISGGLKPDTTQDTANIQIAVYTRK